MSFKAFQLEHKHFSFDQMHVAYVAWLACSAESEAKLAERLAERDALRRERDFALAEWLKVAKIADQFCATLSAPARRKPVGCFLVDCRIIGPHRHDGEPTRKP